MTSTRPAEGDYLLERRLPWLRAFVYGRLSQAEKQKRRQVMVRDELTAETRAKAMLEQLAFWRGAISRELGGWVQEPRYLDG